MDYELSMTDTDNSNRQTQNWRWTPGDTPSVEVPTPPLARRLDAYVAQNFGGVRILEMLQVTHVTEDVHRQLVEESLREYSEIWRRLAAR